MNEVRPVYEYTIYFKAPYMSSAVRQADHHAWGEDYMALYDPDGNLLSWFFKNEVIGFDCKVVE